MKFFLFTLVILFNMRSALATDSTIDLNAPLDGYYEMTMIIGEKSYAHFLELKGKDTPIDMTSFNGQITGSIATPGNCKSTVLGFGYCTLWNPSCYFQFETVANVNGADFKVIYKADFAKPDYLNFIMGEVQHVNLTGTAYLEDGKVLGTFKAISVR